MACRQSWVVWLGLAICASSSRAPAIEPSTTQARAAARIPLAEIPAPLRERVRQVVEQPTLYAHGPAELFGGSPALYYWLLDHPDRGVAAWRLLGARCAEITEHGGNSFRWADGRGSEVQWQVVSQAQGLRVWYAEGKAFVGPLLPTVPVRAVLMMRFGERQDGPGHAILYHQPDVFLLTDSKTALMVTRMLGASAPRIAEQCLGQVGIFFSGLVWYLDQHPERTPKLLGSQAPVPSGEVPLSPAKDK